jgi:hypothetical protein
MKSGKQGSLGQAISSQASMDFDMRIGLNLPRSEFTLLAGGHFAETIEGDHVHDV